MKTPDFYNQTQRLSKLLASSGYCSRRKAEELILQKRIMVNRVWVEEPGYKCLPTDEVFINSQKVNLQAVTPQLWLYNKPPNVVTTHLDPQGRNTTQKLLSKLLPHIKYPLTVGRLDQFSEGLLLVTNCNSLCHYYQTSSLKRQYLVTLTDTTMQNFNNFPIKLLAKNFTLEGINYKPVHIQPMQKVNNSQIFKFTLTQGKNREIREIAKFFKLKVVQLQRIAFGPFKLKGLPLNQIMQVPIESSVLQKIYHK